jgi:hypothetical protein
LAVGEVLNICAKQISFDGEPVGIDVEFIECDCADVWLVEECIAEGATGVVANTEFVTLPGGLPGTGFISLVGDPCTYRLLYKVPVAQTAEFLQYEGVTDCNEVCNSYRVTNAEGAPKVVQYIDCEQNPQNTSEIPAGGSVDICATRITNLPANVSITKISCGCIL